MRDLFDLLLPWAFPLLVVAVVVRRWLRGPSKFEFDREDDFPGGPF